MNKINEENRNKKLHQGEEKQREEEKQGEEPNEEKMRNISKAQ
jgi:hypothetical protein